MQKIHFLEFDYPLHNGLGGVEKVCFKSSGPERNLLISVGAAGIEYLYFECPLVYAEITEQMNKVSVCHWATIKEKGGMQCLN